MAKGKHSTALFEVIHSGNRPERVAQSLRTPKWWFKGRPAAPPAATETPQPPSFEEPSTEAEPEPAPARARSARASRRGRSSAVHFEFDRDRQEIMVRLRYTTALVSLFSVCVLVALAYVTGRHISRGPQAASAAEQHIVQLQQQPPQRGVTDISRPRRQQQASIASESSKRVVEQPVQQPKQHDAPPPELAGVETHLPRAIDLNYVIIQSYPRERKETAEQAREFFTKNGIPCTLVSLDANKSDWICLVGTYGFKRISSPEYKEYRQKISDTCTKGNGAKFDQFKPYAYKWRGAEVPAE